MLDRDLVKHSREIRRNIQNRHYEMTEDGLALPGMGAMAFGEYLVSSTGYEDSIEPNILPIEGLNFLLDSALGGSPANACYLAIYQGNYSPNSGLTASAFAGTANEITSANEGYAESTRPEWKADNADNGARDNVDNKADFNIRTQSEITIRGAALLTDSIKGSTTGALISCSRFQNARTHYNDDLFQLAYRVRLQSS